jgi:NADPH:quinone reductase
MADALALSEGQTVVVVGASGGVGSYFVELAARPGARVIAISRGENADYARSLGAADAIDYEAGDVVDGLASRSPDGIDTVADMHGDAEQLSRLAANVSSGGRVASVVGAADVEALGARGIEGTNVQGRVSAESLEILFGMLEAGELVPPAIRTYSLGDAGEALAAVGSTHVRGKIVVALGEEL